MKRLRRLQGSLLFLTTLLLAPALSQDTLDLAFSNDGRYLAQLNENGSINIWNLQSDSILPQNLTFDARGAQIAWHPEKPWLAFTISSAQGSQCVVVNVITKQTIAATSQSGHAASPVWLDEKTLLFIKSTPGDPADIWSLDIKSMQSRPRLELPHAQWGLSSSRNKKRPVLYISNNHNTEELQYLTSFGRHRTLSQLGQGYHFQQIPSPQWDNTAQWITCIDRPTADGPKRVIGVSNNLRQTDVWYSGKDIISQVYCTALDRLYIQDGKGLLLIDGARSGNTASRRETWHGLSLTRPAIGNNSQIAVIVERQTPAVRNSDDDKFRLLLTDTPSHLRLAEKLCLKDEWQAAEKIYHMLLKNIDDPLERSDIHLHRLAWMRKTRPIEETKKYIRSLSETEPPVVDPLHIAFEKTLFQLFEENKPTKALLELQQLVKVSSHPPRIANEALVILSTRSGILLEHYIKARAALRQEKFNDALEQYNRLAELAPSDPLVIEAVLSAIADPFGYESLIERKNPYTEGYLSEDLLALLNKLDSKAAPLVLIQERMNMQMRLRDYTAARKSARAIVERQGIEGLGVKEFLRYYIEAERSEWSAQDLLGEVLLDPAFRDELIATQPHDTELKALFDVAAAKVALLEGDNDKMETALNSAKKNFKQNGIHDSETLRLQACLWLYAARHHERLRQWNDATQDYTRAIKYLWIYAPQDIEMDIMLRASRTETQIAAASDKSTQEAVWQMQMILRGMGDPLVNPTRHPERLREAARQLQSMLRATPNNSPLVNNLHLHLGIAMMRLDLPLRAEKHLTEALKNKPHPATQAALLLTIAQCNELREDYNRAAQTWLQLTKTTLHRAGQDALRQRRANALQNIGRKTEADDIWTYLAAHALSESTRQDAILQLGTLKDK